MKIKECNISRILFVVSIIFFFIIQIFIYKVQTKIKSNTEIGVEILNTKIIYMKIQILKIIYGK